MHTQTSLTHVLKMYLHVQPTYRLTSVLGVRLFYSHAKEGGATREIGVIFQGLQGTGQNIDAQSDWSTPCITTGSRINEPAHLCS